MATERLDIEIRAREQARQIIEDVRREAREANESSRREVEATQQQAVRASREMREEAGRAVGRNRDLGRSLDDVADAAGRVPGPIGDIAQSMGSFVAGGAILVGLTLIVEAFARMAENARAAAAESERLLALDPLGRTPRVGQDLSAVSGQIVALQDELQGSSVIGIRAGVQRLLGRGPEQIKKEIEGLRGIYAELAQAAEEQRKKAADAAERASQREVDAARRAAEAAEAKAARVQAALDREARAYVNAELARRGRPNFGQLAGDPNSRTGSFAHGENPLATGPKDVLILEPIQQIDTRLTHIAESMGETELFIRQNSRALVGAIGGAAVSIAQFADGNTAGGLGGLFGALAFVPGIGQGLSLGLGVAGVGFSLIDALTDDRTRDTQRDAHLEALRIHEEERPPANIILVLDPADPNVQRLITDTRREAQASGFSPRFA